MARKIEFYCESPQALNQDTLLKYKEALMRYPYCQYAHLAFLLNLRQTDDEATYQDFLSQAAICLPDRARLKEQVEALVRPVSTTERPVQEVRRSAEPKSKKSAGFSPFQDSLPMRSAEGFSPWSEALPLREAWGEGSGPGGPHTIDGRGPGGPRSIEGRSISSRIPSRAQTDAIIDRFMQNAGTSSDHFHISVDEDFDYNSFDPDTGGSNREDFSMGGETLAELYLKNGSPQKAIAVYENLRLNFPEKSVYFANLIKKVKRDYCIK